MEKQIRKDRLNIAADKEIGESMKMEPIDAVREADTQAKLTGYPQAIIVRDGLICVVTSASVRDSDTVLEVVRPV